MSTSFVDFQPKENNNEASESVDDELGKDENSTLIKTVDCLLYKLEEIGDYKIKKNFCESIQLENLQLNDKTFSFSNYLCVVLKTMICPIVIQSPVLFNVNFNGYLKIWINNKIVYDNSDSNINGDRGLFSYKFISSDPHSVTIVYKTINDECLLDIKSSAENIEDLEIKTCKVNNFENIDTLWNILGEKLTIFGDVHVEDDLIAKGCIISESVNVKDVSTENLSSINAKIGDLYINNSQISSISSPVMIENFEFSKTNTESNIKVPDTLKLESNIVCVTGDLLVKGLLQYNSLQVGIKTDFENNLNYPKYGKISVIGHDNWTDGPHINSFIHGNTTPIFQISSTKYQTALNFNCHYNSIGELKTSNEMYPSTQIKSTKYQMNVTDALTIDLKEKNVEFNQQVKFGKSVLFREKTSFENYNGELWNIGITNDNSFCIKNTNTSINFKDNTLFIENINVEKLESKSVCFDVEKTSIKNNLDINGCIVVSQTQDVVVGHEKIASIVTYGGVYVGKSVNIQRELTCKKIKVKSQVPLIILDGTEESYPILGNHGLGCRLILKETKNPLNSTDLAIGSKNGSLWYSSFEPTSDCSHEWFFGTTKVMNLDGLGNLSVNGGIGGGGIYFNNLEHGLHLNGKNTSINFNNSFKLSTNTDNKFSINNYMTLDPTDCNINVLNTNMQSLKVKDNIQTPQIVLTNGSSNGVESGNVELEKSGITVNGSRIIDWVDGFIINSKKVFTTSPIVEYVSNNFSIKRGDNKILLHTTRDGCNIPQLLTETITSNSINVLGNVSLDTLHAKTLNSNIVSCLDIHSDLSLKIDVKDDIILNCENIVFNSSGVQFKSSVVVTDLKVKNLWVDNGKFISKTLENTFEKVIWYNLGKINNTSGSFGIEEHGSLHLYVKDGLRNLDFTANIKHGNVECTFSDTDNNNNTDTTDVQVFKNTDDDYFVYIKLPVNKVIFCDIRSFNGYINIEKESIVKRELKLVYDTSTEIPNKSVQFGDVITKSLVSDTIIINKVFELNTDINVKKTDWSINGPLGSIIQFDKDNTIFQSVVIGKQLGTSTLPWKEIHVDKITTREIYNKKYIGQDVTITNLHSTFNEMENLKVCESCVFEKVQINNELHVLKQVVLKGKLSISGSVSIGNTTEMKDVKVFGALYLNNGIRLIGDKPLIISTKSINLDNESTLEYNDSRVTLSTTLKPIFISPANNDIVKIFPNGQVIFGTLETEKSGSLSPMVNLSVHGKLNVSREITAKFVGSDVLCSKLVNTDEIQYENGSSFIKTNENNSLCIYPRDGNKCIVIDDNLCITSNKLITTEIKTDRIETIDIKTKRLDVKDIYLEKLKIKHASFEVDTKDLLKVEINEGYPFTFSNKGEFLSKVLSTSELKVETSILARDLYLESQILIGKSNITFRNGSTTFVNNSGDIYIKSAGGNGIHVASMTGNITSQGTVSINSGLDLYTTGVLDKTSAALYVKGGCSIGGTLSVKAVLFGNITITSLPESDYYNIVLPTQLPTSKKVLECDENGNCEWVDSCSHKCGGHVVVEESKTLEPTCCETVLDYQKNNETLIVKPLNCEIENLKVSECLVDNLKFGGGGSVIRGILYGKVKVGNNSGKKSTIDIHFETQMPHVNYVIVGNVVSYLNNTSHVFICTFKNLSVDGCSVTVMDLDGDNGWDDLTLSVHYTATF
jgi:hypothetical protein